MKPQIQSPKITARLNRVDLEKILNRGRQTIWRMVKKGDLPPPQYINGQMSWDAGDIKNWLSRLQTYEERQIQNLNSLR